MKKFTKILSLVLIVICGLLVFTGCGAKDNGNDDNNNQPKYQRITYNEYKQFTENTNVVNTLHSICYRKITLTLESYTITINAHVDYTNYVDIYSTPTAFANTTVTRNNTTYNLTVYFYDGDIYFSDGVGKYYMDYTPNYECVSNASEIELKSNFAFFTANFLDNPASESTHFHPSSKGDEFCSSTGLFYTLKDGEYTNFKLNFKDYSDEYNNFDIYDVQNSYKNNKLNKSHQEITMANGESYIYDYENTTNTVPTPIISQYIKA